jgi:hypothetical protein
MCAEQNTSEAEPRFFQDYKQLEHKTVEVEEILPPTAAHPVIQSALDEYATKYAPPWGLTLHDSAFREGARLQCCTLRTNE